MGNCAEKADAHLLPAEAETQRIVRASSQFDLEAKGLFNRNLSLKNSLVPANKRLVHPAGVYEGVVSEELANGYGKLETDDYVYDGEWKAGRPNGRGKIQYRNGTICAGQFVDGLPHGVCRLEDSSGFAYNGGFVGGLFDGQGEANWADGKRYVGEFKAGKYEGEGEHVWPDGRVYRGGYKSGKRHGRGVIMTPNGSRVEGNWVDGALEGQNRQNAVKANNVAVRA